MPNAPHAPISSSCFCVPSLLAQSDLGKCENVLFMIHSESGEHFQGPSHPQGPPHFLTLVSHCLAGQAPYFRVTVMPLLSLSRPRQGAKNIYDSLPQRREELGRFFFLSMEHACHRPSASRMSSHHPEAAFFKHSTLLPFKEHGGG